MCGSLKEIDAKAVVPPFHLAYTRIVGDLISPDSEHKAPDMTSVFLKSLLL